MLKQTRQRQAILDLIRQADEHLTAAQVYERVRRVLPTIGFATVYRNLNAMAEEGIVRVIRVGDVSQFDRRTERHDHLICRRCGKVVDVQLPLQEDSLEAAARETGFRIEEHHTELRGLCSDCS